MIKPYFDYLFWIMAAVTSFVAAHEFGLLSGMFFLLWQVLNFFDVVKKSTGSYRHPIQKTLRRKDVPARFYLFLIVITTLLDLIAVLARHFNHPLI